MVGVVEHHQHPLPPSKSPNTCGTAAPTGSPGSVRRGAGRTGVVLNTLAELRRRDSITATPWHEHVPTRIEFVTTR